MDALQIENLMFQGFTCPTEHVSILLIKGTRGMLGCGYFSVGTADKCGDALAVVSGVKDYNDMLDAEVKAVSSAAAAIGVQPGMTGREALLKMS